MVCQTVEKSLKEATEAEGANKCVDIRYGQYDPETAANEAEDLVNSGADFSIMEQLMKIVQRQLLHVSKIWV